MYGRIITIELKLGEVLRGLMYGRIITIELKLGKVLRGCSFHSVQRSRYCNLSNLSSMR